MIYVFLPNEGLFIMDFVSKMTVKGKIKALLIMLSDIS